ncbi:hypothetical protein ACFLQI_03435 [Candidatus Undinarchaeota archaeon]
MGKFKIIDSTLHYGEKYEFPSVYLNVEYDREKYIVILSYAPNDKVFLLIPGKKKEIDKKSEDEPSAAFIQLVDKKLPKQFEISFKLHEGPSKPDEIAHKILMELHTVHQTAAERAGTYETDYEKKGVMGVIKLDKKDDDTAGRFIMEFINLAETEK